MQFNVEEDVGRITLWIAPSNPAEVPAVSVSLDEGAGMIINANVEREDIRSYGLHGSGQCGFLLTNAEVPGVETAPLVTVREVESDLIIYRRNVSGGSLEGRLFRLETSARRHTEIDNQLAPRYHVAYPGIEQHSAETAKTVLRIPYVVSMYASGRVPLDALEDVLRRHGYKVALVVRDPVFETYERLQLLAKPEENETVLSSLMPSDVAARAARQLAGLDMRRLDELGSAIGRLDNEAMSYLSDPLTRQLIQTVPGQPLPRDAAQKAILRIAEIDVVAVEDDLDGFFQLVTAVMGADPAFGLPNVAPFTFAAGTILRQQTWFIRLIRNDLAVYQAVVDAAADIDRASADEAVHRASSSHRL